VKERPIIFTADSVRAILEGRKMQTRRVVKPQPVGHWGSRVPPLAGGVLQCITVADWKPRDAYIRCPYGVVGDRLWVRETWQGWHSSGEELDRGVEHESASYVTYKADGKSFPVEWRSPLFMPHWASRITLEITDVRVQRVQEINKADAIAEGISVFPLQSADDPSAWYQSAPGVNQQRSARASYAALWDSINAKRGFSWQSNPWVWCLTFRKLPQEVLEYTP